MAAIRHSVLIVDDEPAQRQFMRAVLGPDYDVTSASSAEEAQQLLQNRNFSLVITDQKMPGMSGVELLLWIKEKSAETPVIVLTAYGTIDSAVEAMKLGAEDYLSKPVASPDEVRLTVSRVLDRKRLAGVELIRQQEQEAEYPSDVIAESKEMQRALRLAEKVATQPTTVLLTGESGTGKEVVARFIHRRGSRPEGPFVAVNCAALSENLLESELFGHEKGAFTGATTAKQGRFELAHAGTLFLDEIGEMDLNVQSKLLRVLQDHQFERVGGTRTITVDVRVIAATNRDLRKAMGHNTFREDLFYRLNVFPIELPPLRERRTDILPLAEHFVRKISGRMGRPAKKLSHQVKRILQDYDWPGNIRELQNALERALIISQGGQIQPEDLPLPGGTDSLSGEKAGTLAEMEKHAILAALERHGGDRKLTAIELGISLRTLQYRLKEYGQVAAEAD